MPTGREPLLGLKLGALAPHPLPVAEALQCGRPRGRGVHAAGDVVARALLEGRGGDEVRLCTPGGLRSPEIPRA